MIFSALATELEALDARGLRRTRRVLDSPQAARVTVEGRPYVAFCSNDYLGLAADPRLVRAAQEGCARYALGAGASHLVLGHGAAHHTLEAALARFLAVPGVLLFASGYLANIGVVTALTGREDAVFADRLNHASLNDGCLLSRARFRRYPHCDLEALERLLRSSPARRRLIVTDAVFSMDGDIAPLPALVELAERYDAWLLVDDAHGFGVLGEGGRGALSRFGIVSPRVIYMATLGKAVGIYGAFVAAAAPVVETLIQRARSYIYTTATPPALAHAACASLKLVESETWRRERLARLVARLRRGLAAHRWRLLPSETPIQPLVIGDNAAALAAADRLRERGLMVPAIRPPTVPSNTARLRISLSAAHEEDDVEQLVAALHEIARE